MGEAHKFLETQFTRIAQMQQQIDELRIQLAEKPKRPDQ